VLFLDEGLRCDRVNAGNDGGAGRKFNGAEHPHAKIWTDSFHENSCVVDMAFILTRRSWRSDMDMFRGRSFCDSSITHRVVANRPQSMDVRCALQHRWRCKMQLKHRQHINIVHGSNACMLQMHSKLRQRPGFSRRDRWRITAPG
jgi:hypothetical protein